MAGDAPSGEMKQRIIKYSSLLVLVIQNTSLVLFMKYAMHGNRPKFLKTMTVLFAEAFKCFSSVVLVFFEHGSIRKGLEELYQECIHKRRDFLMVIIPAAVYVVQNILLYVAVDNLPAATFMVTYQLKILTTALFTVVVLKRRLSVQQWVALFFLFAGVVIVQWDKKVSDMRDQAEKELLQRALNESDVTPRHSNEELQNAFDDLIDGATNATNPPTPTVGGIMSTTMTPSTRQENSIVGFVAVLTACVMSGFAGIFFEKILKGSKVSIWVRNFQLAGPSMFLCIFAAFTWNNKEIMADGTGIENILGNMMQGIDWAVWVTVAIQAFGGLVVAVVIKFADNILKAFATSFAIVLNCILAYFLFSFRPTMFFVLGACMVIGAVFVYSLYPYRTIRHPLQQKEDGEEMVEMEKEEVEKGKVEKEHEEEEEDEKEEREERKVRDGEGAAEERQPLAHGSNHS